MGFSIASSFAAYHLLEEYRQASAVLQTSVDELKLSTERVGFLVCQRSGLITVSIGFGTREEN